jgi:hypothetical protein
MQRILETHMPEYVMPKLLATALILIAGIGLAFVDTGFDPNSRIQRFLGRMHNMDLSVKEDGSLQKGAKRLIYAVLAAALALLWLVLPNSP